MREFRPPVRTSVLRSFLAIVLPLVLIVPMGGLALITLGVSQATYTIADGALTVSSGDLFSGKRSVRIPDVTDVSIVGLRGGRRTAGTALPGFCAGRYSYTTLGAVWQVTDCSGRALVIRASTEALPIVITPPDLEGFAAKVRSGEATAVTLPPASKGGLRLLFMVLAPLMLITLGMLSALLLLGPSRMRYVVGGGMLEVLTMFGRKRWPLQGARARVHTPTRLWRVAGTGMPGYFTGIFRESGESTRAYGTVTDRVVLIEGPARVIVTPEDREGFLAALRAEGAQVDGGDR